MEEEEARGLHERLKAMLDSTEPMGEVATSSPDGEEDDSLKYLHDKLNHLMTDYGEEGSDDSGSRELENDVSDNIGDDNYSDKGGDIECSDDDISDKGGAEDDENGRDDGGARQNDKSDNNMSDEGGGSDAGSTSIDSEGSYECFDREQLDIRSNVEWLFGGAAVFPLILRVEVMRVQAVEHMLEEGDALECTVSSDGVSVVGDRLVSLTDKSKCSISMEVASPHSAVVLTLQGCGATSLCAWRNRSGSLDISIASVPLAGAVHKSWFSLQGALSGKVLLAMSWGNSSGQRSQDWAGAKRLVAVVERVEGLPPRAATLEESTYDCQTYTCETLACVCALSVNGTIVSTTRPSSVLAGATVKHVSGPSEVADDISADMLIASCSDTPSGQTLVLDVKFAARWKGAKMVLSSKGDGVNQRWKFLGGRLVPVLAPHLCLDVKGGRARAGGAVILWRVKEPKEMNQMWQFDDRGHLVSLAVAKKGKKSIKKLVLGVMGDKVGGATLVLCEVNSSDAIQWSGLQSVPSPQSVTESSITLSSESSDGSLTSDSDDFDTEGDVDDVVAALEGQIAKARREGEEEVAAALASDLREVLFAPMATAPLKSPRKKKGEAKKRTTKKSKEKSPLVERERSCEWEEAELGSHGPVLYDDMGCTVHWPVNSALLSVDVHTVPNVSISLIEAEGGRPLTSPVTLPLCRGGCESVCNCIGRETSWRSFSIELPLLDRPPTDMPMSRESVSVAVKACWLHEASSSVRALVSSPSVQLNRSVTTESEPDVDDGATAKLKQLWSQPCNSKCADCGQPTSWASVSLGVFLCIRCAGLHRGLGTHISFVRSLELDSWTMEQVEHVAAIGNDMAALVYAAKLHKPPPVSSTEQMRELITDKYVLKKYVSQVGTMLSKIGLHVGDRVEVMDEDEDEWSMATVVGVSDDDKVVGKLDEWGEAYEWDHWRSPLEAVDGGSDDSDSDDSGEGGAAEQYGEDRDDSDSDSGSYNDDIVDLSHYGESESLSDYSDDEPQWLVLENMDAFPGQNAFVLPFVGLAAAKSLAVNKYEGFAWHRRKAFFRSQSACELLRRAVPSPNCSLHVLTVPPKLELHVIGCTGLNIPEADDGTCLSVAYFTETALGKSLLDFQQAPRSREWEYYLDKQTAKVPAGGFPLFEETLNSHLPMEGDYGVIAVMVSRKGEGKTLYGFSRLQLSLRSLIEGRHWKHEIAVELRDARGRPRKGVVQLIARWVLR